MSQAQISGSNSLVLLLKFLAGAGLLFIIFIFVAIPGVKDLPRTIYNYSRRSPLIIVWNGVEFKLPPPWFRLGNKEQVDGEVTFFRDQFPSAQHVFSSITLKPPFSNDFAQDPEKGLGRWEHLHDSVWSIPNAYPKVITSYYSNAYRAKHAFRCANTVLQVRGETLMNIDCIETRDGWRFDYEGVPDDASEGMSVLQKSM